MKLSKKHKPWDVCTCEHTWGRHTRGDDGPCSECSCSSFSWKAIPEAIRNLKGILKDLDK